MLVLAVDTTSAHGSMALVDGSALVALLGFSAPRPKHAENLLPTLDYLLAHAEKKLTDVDGFVVASGPGSFTGLRIGIAAVEGLAYSLARPAVGVSTLDATAYRYRHRRGVLVALIDAYRGEVYGAAYRSDGEVLAPVGDASCARPESFLDALPETPELIAGSATRSHRRLLDERFPRGVTIAEPSWFVAEELARLGAQKLARGERAPLGGLDAFYIRPSEAERNRRRGSRS